MKPWLTPDVSVKKPAITLALLMSLVLVLLVAALGASVVVIVPSGLAKKVWSLRFASV
jgi:hypothetical protein